MNVAARSIRMTESLMFLALLLKPSTQLERGAVTGRADCIMSNGLCQGLILNACSLSPCLVLSSGLTIFKGYKDGFPDSSV